MNLHNILNASKPHSSFGGSRRHGGLGARSTSPASAEKAPALPCSLPSPGHTVPPGTPSTVSQLETEQSPNLPPSPAPEYCIDHTSQPPRFPNIANPSSPLQPSTAQALPTQPPCLHPPALSFLDAARITSQSQIRACHSRRKPFTVPYARGTSL